jgi:hypothetical protein
LPGSISPFIDLVAPVGHFPPARHVEAARFKEEEKEIPSSSEGYKIYPSDIRTLYKV